MQNMGWTPSNTLWLATRGGDVYLSPQRGISEKFDQAKLGSRGFGILDVGCAPFKHSPLHLPPLCCRTRSVLLHEHPACCCTLLPCRPVHPLDGVFSVLLVVWAPALSGSFIYCACMPRLLRGRQLVMRNVTSERAPCPCRFLPGKQTGYAVGGSGTLFKTEDNGVTWKRDRCATACQSEHPGVAGAPRMLLRGGLESCLDVAAARSSPRCHHPDFPPC